MTPHARLRDRLRTEDGFTLVEVMVASVLMIIVLIAVLSLADTSQRVSARDIERSSTLDESKTRLHAMTRELRQAQGFYQKTANTIEVRRRILGVTQRVRYRCDGTAVPPAAGMSSCIREILPLTPVTPAPAPTSSAVYIPRIHTPTSGVPAEEIFRYTNNPSGGPQFVRVTLQIPARGSRSDGHAHRFVLEDGFYVRNCDLEVNSCATP